MNYQSKQYEKRKLKKLYDETKNCYGAGAYFDERKKRIVRYSLNSGNGNTRYWKRIAAKAARKNPNILLNGNKYRKCFDYWWTLI